MTPTSDGAPHLPSSDGAPHLLKRLALPVASLVAANIIAGRALKARPNNPIDLAGQRALVRPVPSPLRQAALHISWIADVPRSIAGCAVATALTYRLTRQARGAAALPLAIATASGTHVLTSLAVGRPRPAVERSGTEQITSSFPSGHVGAVTSQLVVLSRYANRLPRAPRLAARTALALYPLILGASRIHTGQHHTTDVLAGLANGVIAAQLAKRALNLPKPTNTAARSHTRGTLKK